MGKSLGLIEFVGYVPAICAADTALKAANVCLIGLEKVTGGIVTVKLIGDVDAIYAAVESAKNFSVGKESLRSCHVIPRLDDAVESLLLKKEEKEEIVKETSVEVKVIEETKKEDFLEETEEDLNEEIVEEPIVFLEKTDLESVDLENTKDSLIEEKEEEPKLEEKIEVKEKIESKDLGKDEIDLDVKKISKMRVKDLKKKIKVLNPTISTNKLKALKKKELIDILLKYSKEGDS